MLIFHVTEKPGKPDPPEIVQVNKNSVALKWKPPKDDGGADITNYVVEFRIEGMNSDNYIVILEQSNNTEVSLVILCNKLVEGGYIYV